jgi:hypothetical protein
VSAPKIISAIPNTRPTFSHLEAEELMEILLKSGHPRAEYLATKLVTSSGDPGVYAKTLARVRTHVILTAGEHIDGDPIPAQLLQKLVLAAFPEAADFELVGWHKRYRCEGVTFSLGEGRWRFAAPNGYVPHDDSPTRSAATAAFGAYMEGIESNH